MVYSGLCRSDSHWLQQGKEPGDLQQNKWSAKVPPVLSHTVPAATQRTQSHSDGRLPLLRDKEHNARHPRVTQLVPGVEPELGAGKPGNTWLWYFWHRPGNQSLTVSSLREPEDDDRERSGGPGVFSTSARAGRGSARSRCSSPIFSIKSAASRQTEGLPGVCKQERSRAGGLDLRSLHDNEQITAVAREGPFRRNPSAPIPDNPPPTQSEKRGVVVGGRVRAHAETGSQRCHFLRRAVVQRWSKTHSHRP
ncbi:hypothetical protein SKAU_G00255860 [Synaphobranchus kaupii]|uniref:Uncharacterized protein n=1 Tax=Synaphobranchus kaupii TaxID=118154 RepID=A0A9Q1F3Z0_SYNKA|nr:hypothetical protein SKAU_G00255860 [Synaphobranchus kaupii]